MTSGEPAKGTASEAVAISPLELPSPVYGLVLRIRGKAWPDISCLKVSTWA